MLRKQASFSPFACFIDKIFQIATQAVSFFNFLYKKKKKLQMVLAHVLLELLWV